MHYFLLLLLKATIVSVERNFFCESSNSSVVPQLRSHDAVSQLMSIFTSNMLCNFIVFVLLGCCIAIETDGLNHHLTALFSGNDIFLIPSLYIWVVTISQYCVDYQNSVLEIFELSSLSLQPSMEPTEIIQHTMVPTVEPSMVPNLQPTTLSSTPPTMYPTTFPILQLPFHL